MAQDHPGGHAAEKGRVALLSLMASGLLALVKFAAAIASGSLGLLSEAFHSLLDFGATALTLFAIRVSDRPADDQHQFGHAKVESVAALVETGMLLAVTGWVSFEAVKRLLYGGHDVTISWWLFVIIIGSIVIDFNRSRALKATADKTSSDALAADALHFHADMLSSIAVLAGLIFTWLGYEYADPLAALVVAGFVGHAALGLGRQTLATLLDAAPEGATEKISELIQATNGVLGISQLRVRPAGPTLFVDLTVDVARTLPSTTVDAIRATAIKAIQDHYEDADVSVQVQGVALDSETALDKVNLVAGQHGLAIHHLVVQDIDGRLAVSFDVEMDGDLSIANAHTQATHLEGAIRDGLGADVEVESHIEPSAARLLSGAQISGKLAKNVEAQLGKLCRKETALSDLHNVRVRQNEAGLYVHYHCRFAPDQTIQAVHDVIDRVEVALIDAMPQIKRVVAHAEPVGIEPHAL